MKRILQSLFVITIAILCASWVQSIGIAMRFVDITLEYVEPGASFNLRVLKNLPFVVINLDDENDTDVAIESQVPNPNEMKEGYEPIPDPSWVKVVPDRYHLGPKASASSDVVVQIPNDPKLVGHHYEVILWAHTDAGKQAKLQGAAGLLLQAGLRSRLRMSIGIKGPASLQHEKQMKRLAEINLNFSISPDNLFVLGVPVGAPVDLKTIKKASLKVINEADDPVKLKLESVAKDANILPQAGYDFTPDPKWLTVTPVISVPGSSIKELKLSVNIPDKPEYRNKKYMFLIRASLADESLPLAYNNMLYITTAP
jgi:hypothetical protein